MGEAGNPESIEGLVKNLFAMFVESYGQNPNLLIAGPEAYRRLYHELKAKLGGAGIAPFDLAGHLKIFWGMEILISHSMDSQFKVMFAIG